MKGFIARTTRSVCLLGGLLGMAGCAHYRDVVDPCYPERYNAMAREEFREGIAPQVQNGRVMDQTVWDSHFEIGTAKLTAGGIEHLNYINRRRPCPDTNVYVQTAQTLPTDMANQTKPLVFDPANPEKMIEARNRLNQDRKEMVQKYLLAASNGRNLNYNVEVLDVATPGMAGVPANSAMRIRMMAPPSGALPRGDALPSAATFGNTGAWQ